MKIKTTPSTDDEHIARFNMLLGDLIAVLQGHTYGDTLSALSQLAAFALAPLDEAERDAYFEGFVADMQVRLKSVVKAQHHHAALQQLMQGEPAGHG